MSCDSCSNCGPACYPAPHCRSRRACFDMPAGRRELNFAPASLLLDPARAGTAPAGIAPAADFSFSQGAVEGRSSTDTSRPFRSAVTHRAWPSRANRHAATKNAGKQRHDCEGGRGREAYHVRRAEGDGIVASRRPDRGCTSTFVSGAFILLRHDLMAAQLSRIGDHYDASPRRPGGLRFQARIRESSDALTMNLVVIPAMAFRGNDNRGSSSVNRRTHFASGPYRLSYSSWRRHHTPVSLRPFGARSSHWYMPHRPSSPRA